jgi:tetratricopeptide (TPR) repeat protein
MERMLRLLPRILSIVLSVALCRPGDLAADAIDRIVAEVDDIRERARKLDERYLKSSGFKGEQYVAERLIDGENFYRIKDYQRSAIIFMDIIENYPKHAAYPDALFLYADSLFLSRDFLTARDWFKRFLDESALPGAGRYKQKAIERLIEIAIHLDSYGDVDQYFGLLGQYPSEEARYVKGKYLYFKKEYDQAKQLFDSINKDRLLILKARYLKGVILTLQGSYTDAIDVFKNGQLGKTENRKEIEIIDLMNLGAGRLYFEQGYLSHASECYQQIDHTSPYFDAALYEAAAVLIQAGDTVRAEQTLEVLTVAVPDSAYLPRARMLRGNLLLRTGRYDEAEEVFDQLVDEYTPIMAKLDTIITQEQDTRRFFSELVESSVSSLDVANILPPLVVKWVGEEPDVSRALDLAKELGAAKGYVKETERLVRLLEAVVDGPSSINAIPLLRQAKRRAQELDNRIGQLRGDLLEIAEDKLGDDIGEIERLQYERQRLAKELGTLPTSTEAFKKRDRKSSEVFRRMRKELQRNAIRLDRLSAMAVAIERFVEDPRYVEGVPEANIKALRGELQRHRVGITKLQESMGDLRGQIDQARYQVGIGDSRDRRDEEIKVKIKELAKKERTLLRTRGGEVGRRIDTTLGAIDEVESRVSRFEREVEAEAERQVQRIRVQVRAERDRIGGYNSDLLALSDEAEEVVGGVAFENFTSVRKRFRDLVLKADVGIIDVAWLKKEEHTSRISEFTQSRLEEIKRLDDEFQEVRSAEEEGDSAK